MLTCVRHQKKEVVLPVVVRLIVCALSTSLVFSPTASYAQSLNLLNLPAPGVMVFKSPSFVPVLLNGMTIHPDNPFRFDFIVDSGNTDFNPAQIKPEAERLVKYFLAAVTVPQNDLWVNLSPYEQNRIIPEELGKTELGRDMLAQDYILKQLTASLIYPEKELGKEFWGRVYKKARQEFGTTEIPVSTFNKVWIIPDKAVIYEHDQSVYIVESHLKVMLDQDYLALQENNKPCRTPQTESVNKEAASLSSQVVREIILPEIEAEVNEGRHFTLIRQIYHSLILAKWYKENLQESLLSQVYVGQAKIMGIDLEDKTLKDQIYQQYLQAFKKGVFNVIKEDYDEPARKIIPRKYFSGGEQFGRIELERTAVISDANSSPIGNHYDLSLRIDPYVRNEFPSSPISKASLTLGEFKGAGYRGIEVADVRFDEGNRSSRGRVVRLNPDQVSLKIWVSPGALAYDFSKYAVTPAAAQKSGKGYKEFPGRTVKEYAESNPENVVFAVNGHQGNFWTGNSVAIIDGRLIAKTAPGIAQNEVEPLTGEYSFFVFDGDKLGIEDIDLSREDSREKIRSIQYAIGGPVLRKKGKDVSGNIKTAMPPRKNDEVAWQEKDRSQAFSVLGLDGRGEIVQFVMTANPDAREQREINLSDVNVMVTKLGLTDAILLGTSADVQQYVKGEEQSGIEAAPAVDTDTGKQGRLLGSVIFAESVANVPAPDEEEVGGIDLKEINVDRKGPVGDIQFNLIESQRVLENGVDGFVPIIINLTPITSLLPILGLEPAVNEEDEGLLSSRFEPS